MAELQECLLCSETAEKESKGKCQFSLKNQIRTLFILRKILEISSSTCSDLLLRTQNNPSTWFSCCAQCYAMVIEAENIFSQMMKLETKWKRMKTSLESKVLDCIPQKTRRQSKQKYGILQLIRQEVVKRLATMKCPEERTENPSSQEPVSPDSDEDLVEDVKVEQEEFIEDFEELNEQYSPMDLNLQNSPSNSTVSNVNRKIDEISKIAEEDDSDFVPSEKSDDDYTPKIVKTLTRSSGSRKRQKAKKLQGGDYRCENCPSSAGYPTLLKKKIHEARYHGIKHEFKCPFCCKNLSSGSTLLRHVKCIHPNNTITDIAEDDNVLPDIKQHNGYNGTWESQIVDIKVESEEEKKTPPKNRVCKSKGKANSVKNVSAKIKCEHCPKLFVSTDSMKFHFNLVHADVEKLPCHLCPKIYVTAGRLARHLKIIHHVQGQQAKRKPSTNSFVSCEQCNKNFKKHYLPMHISVVHRKERNYICEKCPESFTSTSYLRYHQIKVHGLHGERPNSKLECKECCKVFSNPAGMRIHVATIHRKEFKLKCPICGVGRSVQSQLDKHIMSSHTNNRPYRCTLCPKSYIDQHRLTVHMRTHTGEKPFSCSICAKSFHNRTKLGRHMKNVHSRENLFECDKCQKRFPSQNYLTVHKYHAHNNRKRIRAERKLAGKEELEKALSITAKANPPPSDNSLQQRKRTVNSFRVKLTEHCKESSTAEETGDNRQLNIDNVPDIINFDNAPVGTAFSPGDI